MIARSGRMPPHAIPFGIVLIGSLAAATAGSAQQAAGGAGPGRAAAGPCPSTGISITVDGDGLAGSRPATGLEPRAAARLDTTLAFSVVDRTWRWRNVVAQASAGVTGTDGAPWHVCAGAVAALREAALTLRGVTGVIRFRADPSVFQSFRLRSDSVTPGQP